MCTLDASLPNNVTTYNHVKPCIGHQNTEALYGEQVPDKRTDMRTDNKNGHFRENKQMESNQNLCSDKGNDFNSEIYRSNSWGYFQK